MKCMEWSCAAFVVRHMVVEWEICSLTPKTKLFPYLTTSTPRVWVEGHVSYRNSNNKVTYEQCTSVPVQVDLTSICVCLAGMLMCMVTCYIGHVLIHQGKQSFLILFIISAMIQICMVRATLVERNSIFDAARLN